MFDDRFIILGIKFLDEKSTDAREAKVLKYALPYVSIYSNSWGPADTGTLAEHLSSFVKRSLSKGIHRVKYRKINDLLSDMCCIILIDKLIRFMK